MLFYCCAIVVDGGPTVKQHCTKVLCLLGSGYEELIMVNDDNGISFVFTIVISCILPRHDP